MCYVAELSDKARLELFEAWSWYELQQSGLGDRFEDEFYKKIGLVENNPLYYAAKQNYHQAAVDDFPYLIVYSINEVSKMLLVISIFHTSRHPKRKIR